jgi:hypothetical protein
MASVKQNREPKWSFDRISFWRVIEGKLSVEGLTFRDAAPMIGIGHSTLWRIQRHTPDIETVVRVCQWLRSTVDSFVVKS